VTKSRIGFGKWESQIENRNWGDHRGHWVKRDQKMGKRRVHVEDWGRGAESSENGIISVICRVQYVLRSDTDGGGTREAWGRRCRWARNNTIGDPAECEDRVTKSRTSDNAAAKDPSGWATQIDEAVCKRLGVGGKRRYWNGKKETMQMTAGGEGFDDGECLTHPAELHGLGVMGARKVDARNCGD